VTLRAATLIESSLATTASTTAGRALLLSELFPPAVGGSAVLFQGIYSRLADTDVMVLTDGPAVALESARRAGPLRILTRPLATRRWGVLDPKGLWQHLRLAYQVRHLLSRRDGLVHCARALPEGVAAMIARLCGGAPYVCWTHGEDLASAMTSRELTFLTKCVYRVAAAALANSRNTATMLAALGVPEHKIHIVHPAVDADRFHPRVDGSLVRRRYAGSGDILLLSVGRLQRRKGHDVAIQAIAALRDRLPNLRYVIAGDGEERARLEAFVVAHGVQDRVFFAGTIPDEDLPAFYAASDIFLLPNRVDDGDIEGFGIVFLEAAAAGKPVIGGDSGGVPEAVERDVTGLLVDGASVAAVAAAIADLATSEERRGRMGLAGRVRAHRCFSWQRAAVAVSELQRRVASHA
jgi:phosphatidylinositol alpha-1,6-mannosyltransferase